MFGIDFAKTFDKALDYCARSITALGGRSFLLCVGSGLMTTLLCWHAKIDGNIYRDVILGTVGAYIVNTVMRDRAVAKTGSPPQ
jgi:hypothetical protein